jgi:hypothetical protein
LIKNFWKISRENFPRIRLVPIAVFADFSRGLEPLLLFFVDGIQGRISAARYRSKAAAVAPAQEFGRHNNGSTMAINISFEARASCAMHNAYKSVEACL